MKIRLSELRQIIKREINSISIHEAKQTPQQMLQALVAFIRDARRDGYSKEETRDEIFAVGSGFTIIDNPKFHQVIDNLLNQAFPSKNVNEMSMKRSYSKYGTQVTNPAAAATLGMSQNIYTRPRPPKLSKKTRQRMANKQKLIQSTKSNKRLEKKLIGRLNEFDRIERMYDAGKYSEEKYTDYEYGTTLEIYEIMDELSDFGYTEAQIRAIDSRVNNHFAN